MVLQWWIYDAIIYLYALSLLFYFSDFIYKNRKANQTGTILLGIVWGLQSVLFGWKVSEVGFLPVLTTIDSLFFYAWILLTLSLLVNFFFVVDFLVFFINIVGFGVLVLNFFTGRGLPQAAAPYNPASELLFIHISLAFFSYAAFSLAAIFSLMYLIEHQMLKTKKWGHMLQRLPSLQKLDKYTFRSVMVAAPLLMSAIVLGLVWAYLGQYPAFWLDPKVFSSLLVLVAYLIYLVQRMTFRWSGKKLALWNIGAYLAVLLNYLVFSAISNLHRLI